MSDAPIPYGRQSIDDADVRAVTECLRGDWLTQGPTVEAFERGLCEVTGAKHAVAVSSGTAALHVAYLAVGLGPGDVGLTSSVSFVATANAMRYVGADVAFADVDPRTALVDSDRLDAALEQLSALGRSPRIIAPVDLTGQPCDRLSTRAAADRSGAIVIEDAAHSLGASYEVDGRSHRVGSCAHAEAAILSFHPVKHITTAEGGAILTNDSVLWRRMLDLRSHGIHKDPARFTRAADDPWVGPWYYEQADLGFNYRITDLQCALGLSQLGRLPGFVERRREIAKRYERALALPSLSAHLAPLVTGSSVHHAYHLFVVQLRRRDGESLDTLAGRRKALYLALREMGVLCQVHYIPIPWQPYYRASPPVVGAEVAGAAEYYAASLSIPMFPAMTDEMVDRVTNALIACVNADRR